MKPIKMHPKPESQKPAPPKEAPKESTGPLGGQDSIPDPEVPEKKPRRRFTASYKLRILQEVENCEEVARLQKEKLKLEQQLKRVEVIIDA